MAELNFTLGKRERENRKKKKKDTSEFWIKTVSKTDIYSCSLLNFY